MSQICKKCGTVAEDGQEYCSNCYAELGALKKKKAEKHRAELRNMGKKALAFSVIAAVAGIVMMFYLINMEKFSSLKIGVWAFIMPVAVWLGLTGISVFYGVKSFGKTSKALSITTFLLSGAQFVALPLIYILISK